MKRVLTTRLRSALLATSCMLLVTAAAFCARQAHAYYDANRTVQGKVLNGSNAPVTGAVVHLKDTRTLAQKSFITAADGTFRFGQLSTSSDYELWAEFQGKKSSTKSVSSFESKNTFDFTLKVD